MNKVKSVFKKISHNHKNASNNLKKRSITLKLFLITTLFFTAFITVTMIFQSIFIGRFYLSEKTKKFQKSFNSFTQDYNKYVNKNNGLDPPGEWFVDYESKNNAMIATLNLSSFTIGMGQNITENYDGKEIQAFDRNKITSIRAAINLWYNNVNYAFDVLSNRKTIIFKSNLNSSDTSSLISISPVIVNNEVTEILISVTSLQPISEASSVIKSFYIYFYIFAMFLIVILSFFYSNMISKPLKSLNKTASLMANLDFSAKCDVNSLDEIGNLSSTLNFLSENLGNSLNELQNANEKLKEDIEKEKQLEVMRREFVAGVSHELKTPISLISGYAEGLKDNVTNGKKIDYYTDVIIDEADKMSILVSDMLDLSQLESGNFKLYMDEFYIDKFINYFIEKHKDRLLSKKIFIKPFISCTNILVSGDRFRIEQVMNNLLNNAAKYTPQDKAINISVSRIENEVLIEVENPGEKIPENELENIWHKFYKVEKSRNRNLGGTGLGLSIVKNILTLHKSRFGASNTDMGVKFYFTLNICEDEQIY
ncbi:MAG: ATP-binding protein [Bacillota bacterium]|nr:ATP-binding protein [Bacillota bacterium]